MSEEDTCAGGGAVVRSPRGRSPQRHSGARGGCSGGPPSPLAPSSPSPSVGPFRWAPGEGSPRPEWGMGRGALAPLEALPREVRAETEGLGPMSSRRPPLPSKSGDWRRGGLAAPRTPRSPGRRALLEPGAVFWLVVLAVWVRRGCERRRRGQEGKGLASAPGVSCPGQHQVSGGQGQVRSKVLFPGEPAPGGVRGTRGLTSPTREAEGQGGSP